MTSELFLPLLQLLLLTTSCLAKKLTVEENRELQKNCGEYVEGYGNVFSLNGDPVKAGAAPWTVSVVANTWYSIGGGSGTVVSPFHIVTVAHLFNTRIDCTTKALKPSALEEFKVYFNSTCWYSPNCVDYDSNMTEIGIENIFLPDDYIEEYCAAKAIGKVTFSEDFAMLELSEPVQFSSTVWPACLPDRNRTELIEEAIMFGFGINPTAPVVQRRFGTLHNITLHQIECTANDDKPMNRICAESSIPHKWMGCGGDSGSGLLVTKENGRKEIVGALSGGFVNCENHETFQRLSEVGYPLYNVFQNITLFTEWICEKTGVCPGVRLDEVETTTTTSGSEVTTMVPTTPEVDVTTPEVDVTTPEVDVTTPEVDVTTPEVVNTTPEVVYTTPEDVYTTPEDIYTTPEDVYTTPEDVYTTPEDVYTTPEDVYTTPEDVYTTPEDVYTTPEDVYTTPEDVYTTPEDVYTTPEDVYTTPEDVYTTPEDIYTTPEDVYTTPEDIYTTPEDVYTTPEDVYTTPEDVYTTPDFFTLPTGGSCGPSESATSTFAPPVPPPFVPYQAQCSELTSYYYVSQYCGFTVLMLKEGTFIVV